MGRDELTDLDMSFDLYSQFLEMLNDRAIHCSPEIGMLVGDDPSFGSDIVKDVLRER